MARWGSVEYIKEKYLGSNEDYAPLSKDTETYKTIQACFDKVKATVENNRLFGMNGVVDCDKGSHYIIFMSGGANGSGDWREYLKAFNDVLEELEKIGKAWFIELNNDCCDDVWTLRLGIELADKEKVHLIECGKKFSVVDPTKLNVSLDSAMEMAAPSMNDPIQVANCAATVAESRKFHWRKIDG